MPKLDWFEHLPLFGERIVITRAKSQAAELSQRLRATRSRRHRDPRRSNRSLGRLLGSLDACIEQLEILRLDSLHQRERSRVLPSAHCAPAIATGEPSAGASARSAPRPPKLSNRSFPISFRTSITARESRHAFRPYEMRCARVLLPRASAAREVIPAHADRNGRDRRCRRCLHECYSRRRGSRAYGSSAKRSPPGSRSPADPP